MKSSKQLLLAALVLLGGGCAAGQIPAAINTTVVKTTDFVDPVYELVDDVCQGALAATPLEDLEREAKIYAVCDPAYEAFESVVDAQERLDNYDLTALMAILEASQSAKAAAVEVFNVLAK